MSRRRIALLVTMVALTLVTVVSAPAFPMEGPPPEPVEAESAEAPDSTAETVETILREQEELLRGQSFSYDPSGRRDPFRSLFEGNPIKEGKRPRGIAGMLVSEINLAGIVNDRDGRELAMVTGSDNKGYFLRVGDAVYDGTIIAVDPRRGAITFRQQVDDPKLIKPYRDVVKKLVPQESDND